MRVFQVRLSQLVAYIILFLLFFIFIFCQGTDEPVADDMQRLEQQAQAVAAQDVTAKLKEKVLFVRSDSFLLPLKELFMFARRAIHVLNVRNSVRMLICANISDI